MYQIQIKVQQIMYMEYMILVGGTYEYTAGYVADNLRNYGNSFASTDNTTNNKTISPIIIKSSVT